MFCKCTLIGWMGKDPEISQKNSRVANFSVGYQSSKKGADGKYEQNFINCTCFDKTAQNALSYLKKGDKVYIEGNLNIQQYTDKNGISKNATTLLVGIFKILEAKAEKEQKSINGDNGGNAINSGNSVNAINGDYGGNAISERDKALREEIDNCDDDEIPF